MHHFVEEAALPLTWIPTTGNDIPPLAVPLCGGPNGHLYIARGLVGGEMHIGTTSYSSSGGARLTDKYGRSLVVYEYEVLVCASSVRFMLENPTPVPVAETTRSTPRPICRGIESGAETTSPDAPPGKRAPFPWLGISVEQPSAIPRERQGRGPQNDPPPYTSPKGGWIEAPKRPRPIALKPRENVQFKHMAQSKCFTLIDDTPSVNFMQYSWSQTRAALTGVIGILSSDSNWNGLDVRFLQHAEARPCRTVDDFECIFNSVTTWRGEKVMATKVSQVFAESLPLIHDTPTPRPVVLLIITDGIARDTQALFEAIVSFCLELNAKGVPPHMFKIHMLQMGDDRKAVTPLHEFRDRITQRDRARRIFNVVSFHRGRGLLNAQNIFKLLLAATYVPVEEDPDIKERKPPEVIAAQYQEVENIRRLGSTAR